jgi:hypothetical protein
MRVLAWVKHDRLDDEVMVIDLKSGAYFAFIGAAADAWSLLAAGQEPEAVAARLAERYDVAPETAGGDVRAFAGQLVAEGLLEDGPAARTDVADLGGPPGDTTYTAPAIEKYDDLADLLLLDPIHEVDGLGWPAGRGD